MAQLFIQRHKEGVYCGESGSPLNTTCLWAPSWQQGKRSHEAPQSQGTADNCIFLLCPGKSQGQVLWYQSWGSTHPETWCHYRKAWNGKIRFGNQRPGYFPALLLWGDRQLCLHRIEWQPGGTSPPAPPQRTRGSLSGWTIAIFRNHLYGPWGVLLVVK